MKILVAHLNENYKKEGHNPNILARVTTFKNEDKENYDRVTMGLRVPYYVIELNERLEREPFIAFIERLRTTSVNEILSDEAIKTIKKKNDGANKDIVNMIIQVG